MVFKDCRIITIRIKVLITKSTIQRKFKNRNQITARFLFLDENWRKGWGWKKKFQKCTNYFGLFKPKTGTPCSLQMAASQVFTQPLILDGATLHYARQRKGLLLFGQVAENQSMCFSVNYLIQQNFLEDLVSQPVRQNLLQADILQFKFTVISGSKHPSLNTVLNLIG